MRADLQPNSEVTGGAISSGVDAIEVTNQLMESVYEYVLNKQSVTAKELVIFMKQLGLSNRDGFSKASDDSQPFTEQEFKRIIETMVIDQRLEEMEDGSYVAANYSYPMGLQALPNSS